MSKTLQTLLKQMLGGYGSVLDGQLVTKATFGYNPNLKSRPYDPAKAKALRVKKTPA